MLTLLFEEVPLKFCWVITGDEFVDAGVCQMKKSAITSARIMMIATMRVSFFLLGNREAEMGVKESGVSLNSVSDTICPCDGCCCARTSNDCVVKLLNCGVCAITQVPSTFDHPFKHSRCEERLSMKVMRR